MLTDAGAIKYRYEVIDDLHDKLSFDAVAPDAALTPIWSKLRLGLRSRGTLGRVGPESR